MTRRLFIAAVPLVLAAPESPKNRTAAEANQFHEAYVRWAEAFNRVKPGGLDAGEVAAFEPLPGLWRKVERERREWIRGL